MLASGRVTQDQPRTLRLGLLLALAVPALCGVADPARALDLPPLRSGSPPYFTADVAISLDGAGRPGLSVSITVPYPELQWVRVQRGFAAGAELTVVFQPAGSGRRLYGDVWERRIVVPSFGATLSPNATLVEKRSFDVPPGHYQVRVGVRDLDGEQGAVVTDRLEVPDYSRVPVGFADLELGVVDSSGGFVPIPTRSFGFNVTRLGARAVLFDRRPGSWPRGYPFRYRVLDDQGQELLAGQQQVTLSRSADPVVVKPSSSDLFLGSYVFEVELAEGRSRWRVDRSFDVEESGPPRGKEFERMLEALSFIAEPREIEHLRSLRPEEQARGWDEFWRRRDPTPDTPRNEALIEFFRRVRHTERHFQGFGPGWRSDMGRVYIKYGPPDQIESRPGSSTTPPLEIWNYSQPYRRFVFADREGFGRYVLVSPVFE